MTTPTEAKATWKPQVKINGTWSSNQLVFATQDEAEKNASALFDRWHLCEDHRAVVSSEPVNYRFTNGELIRL